METRQSILRKGAKAFISMVLMISVGKTSDSPKGDKATLLETPSRQHQVALKNHDAELVQAVMEALDAIKKESPQVHEDALRVWKNFRANSNPKYTYRFWGSSIVLWLKENKKIVINSLAKCEEVFQILKDKGLISEEAVGVLGLDAWSRVANLEGMPGIDQRQRILKRKREADNFDVTEHKSTLEEFNV